jgi:hypothetical protein
MIKDNDTINSAHFHMKYLDFRQKINKEISEIFDKNNIELNEIELKMEEFMEEILENFKELESTDNFSITAELLDKIELVINEKVNKILNKQVEEYKTVCMKQNERNPMILHEIKQEVHEKFVNLMNDVYKSEFIKDFKIELGSFTCSRTFISDNKFDSSFSSIILLT